jgi:hypothetical protein
MLVPVGQWSVPRTCTICSHKNRLKIEQALVSGTAYRSIANQFGTTKASLTRHRTHVSESLARHTGAAEFVRTGVLIDDVRTGEGRAERLYEQAEAILAGALLDKDRRTALQAIKVAVDVMSEARSYLELRGELTQEGGTMVPIAFSTGLITRFAAAVCGPFRLPWP